MLYNGKATDRLRERPPCNLCPEPAVADACTGFGPWAYLCEVHFKHARGLGVGLGQILLCGDALDAQLIKQHHLEDE